MTTEQTESITKMVAAMPPKEVSDVLAYFIYRLMSNRLNENEAPYCDSEKLGFMYESLLQSSQADEILALDAELDIEEERITDAAEKMITEEF